MKKKLLSFLIFLFLQGGVIFAQATTITVRFRSPITATSFEEMVIRIGNWVFTLAIGITPIMVLVGAYMLVTGGGDPRKIALGKKILLFTLIGFCLVMITRGIIELVKIILGI